MPIIPVEYIERFKSIGGEEAEGHSKDARIEILRDDAKDIVLLDESGLQVFQNDELVLTGVSNPRKPVPPQAVKRN